LRRKTALLVLAAFHLSACHAETREAAGTAAAPSAAAKSVVDAASLADEPPHADCERWPFHCAAERGNTALLDLLLQNGVDVDNADDQGYSALHYAAAHGQEAAVRMLIAAHADVNRVGPRARTPLHLAAAQGIVASLEALLEGGASTAVEDIDHYEPMHTAVMAEHPDALLTLARHGAAVNGSFDHLSPLLLAFTYGKSSVLEMLFTLGAMPTRQGDEGKPLPIWATLYGEAQVAPELVRLGYDLSAIGPHGDTALHVAASGHDPAAVENLLLAGAPFDVRNDSGSTAYEAVLERQLRYPNRDAMRIIEIFLQHEAPADVQVAVTGGRSLALIQAYKRNDMALMQLLVDHGADVNRADEDCRTIADHALADQRRAGIELFVRFHGDLNAPDCHGDYLVYKAFRMGYTRGSQVADALVDAGVDLTVIDPTTHLPLLLYIYRNDPYPLSWLTLFASAAGFAQLDESGTSLMHALVGEPNQDRFDSLFSLARRVGASVDLPDARGATPLHLAAASERFDKLATLSRHPSVADQDGRTVLHALCLGGKATRERARRLLTLGTDPTVADHRGWTALHACASLPLQMAALDEILAHGAAVDARTADEQTPLHLAATIGSAGAAKRLIEAGADIHARDAQGREASELASANSRYWTGALLAREGVVFESYLSLPEDSEPIDVGVTPLAVAAASDGGAFVSRTNWGTYSVVREAASGRTSWQRRVDIARMMMGDRWGSSELVPGSNGALLTLLPNFQSGSPTVIQVWHIGPDGFVDWQTEYPVTDAQVETMVPAQLADGRATLALSLWNLPSTPDAGLYGTLRLVTLAADGTSPSVVEHREVYGRLDGAEPTPDGGMILRVPNSDRTRILRFDARLGVVQDREVAYLTTATVPSPSGSGVGATLAAGLDPSNGWFSHKVFGTLVSDRGRTVWSQQLDEFPSTDEAVMDLQTILADSGSGARGAFLASVATRTAGNSYERTDAYLYSVDMRRGRVLSKTRLALPDTLFTVRAWAARPGGAHRLWASCQVGPQAYGPCTFDVAADGTVAAL
jgi:ankyrin repeat protein